MKTLKFIGMALLAIVLSVNFSACSNDDENKSNDDNNGSGTGFKKPSELTWDDGSCTKLFYDKQQRLCKVEEYTESGYLEETGIIEYNENTIVVTSTYSHNDRKDIDICSLNSEGLIVKAVFADGVTEEYAYDKDKQLIGIQNYMHSTEITWENGNLIAANIKNDDWIGYNTIWKCKYTTIPSSKGFFIFYDDYLIDIFHDIDYINLLANCGYLGKVPQNLLASITVITDEEDTWGISYQFGKDGYVTEISGTEDNEKYFAKLTWD